MLIPNGYAQINHFFTGDAVPTGAQVTYGIVRDDLGLTPTECAQAAANSWLEDFLPEQVSGIVLANTVCKFGPNDVGATGEYPTSSDGGVSNTAEAPMVSLLCVKHTDFGGRQGKGRFFIPGISDADVQENGVVESARLSDWQDAADAFKADLDTRNISMVLLSAEGSPSMTPRLVQKLSISAQVATQRRRNRR